MRVRVRVCVCVLAARERGEFSAKNAWVSNPVVKSNSSKPNSSNFSPWLLLPWPRDWPDSSCTFSYSRLPPVSLLQSREIHLQSTGWLLPDNTNKNFHPTCPLYQSSYVFCYSEDNPMIQYSDSVVQLSCSSSNAKQKKKQSKAKLVRVKRERPKKMIKVDNVWKNDKNT